MIFRTAALIAAIAFVTGAHAQSYPSKPVRLVVPFPPGGTVDITARAIAPALSEALGQNLLVDNRGGAAGMTGSALVAKSPPDGYTLLLGSNSTLSVAPSLSPGLIQYDAVRDFAPISLVGATPFVLVVHPSVPARTVKEFIALAKAKPGSMTMASGGVGHLVGEHFQSITGTKLLHVPYQGTGPAGIALMGGQVDLMFDQACHFDQSDQSGQNASFGRQLQQTRCRAARSADDARSRRGELRSDEHHRRTGPCRNAGGSHRQAQRGDSQSARAPRHEGPLRSRRAGAGAEHPGTVRHLHQGRPRALDEGR
jgi:tripartite-type tricarboxylate transporter receptor subunit TctC